MKHNNHLNHIIQTILKLNKLMRPKFTGEKIFPIESLYKQHRNNYKSFMDENKPPANGNNKPEDISQDIEEMGNCTRRMGRMVRVDSTKMIPSQLRRQRLEEELEDELREALKAAKLEERYKIASSTFNKVIAIDSKFSRALKIIKRVYDDKIEHDSQKYNKIMLEVLNLKKNVDKPQARGMPIHSQHSTGIEETSTS